MDPLPPSNLRFSPNIILANPHHIDLHPYIHLLPGVFSCIEFNLIMAFIIIEIVAHHGFDKDGRPIYWEKTGTIQSNFGEVFKHFTTDELCQYHVQSQECFDVRYEYASKKFNKEITQSVVVFDMKNVQMVLNIQSIAYVKQILAIDQLYYPERLYKLFIINCPWYFTALFNLFKPFIDARTKDKFSILGSDFLPELLECMDISIIPREYGGTCDNVPWDLKNSDDSGCSKQQLETYMREKYNAETIVQLLTNEEIQSLTAAESLANKIKEGKASPWNVDSAAQSETTEAGMVSSVAVNLEPVEVNSPLITETTNNDLPQLRTSSPAESFYPLRTRMVKAEVLV
jgi:hypothetical protein